MTPKKVILVTGVNGAWGSGVAKRLIELSEQSEGNGASARPELHIIGLDAEAPEEEIKGLDFIQADVRNPLLVDLLQSESVEAVCHLAFQESMRPNEAAFDANVIGSMKVLGACAEAGVGKVVLMSSTMVYGALPTNPAFLTEEHALKGSRTYGYVRDWVEVESFCNGFRRQMPDLTLTILRFPNIVGPNVSTPMTRFLSEPAAPVLLGFDPLLQVIHEEDVVEALLHALFNDLTGVYNVAAKGVMPLTKLMGLASKLPIPIFHPLAYWGVDTFGGSEESLRRFAPIEWDYLRYSWVADLERMRTQFGFTPNYTAEETLREYASQQRLRRYLPESAAMAYDEERLRDTLERRRRLRERQQTTEVDYE